MFGKHLTAAMAILTFISCTPMALLAHVNAVGAEQGHLERPAAAIEKQESKIFAQNENPAPDENEKSNSGSEIKGSDSTSGPAADDKNKSSNAKSKPLKPFVPSEKIPGEQAVDFPVDI